MNILELSLLFIFVNYGTLVLGFNLSSDEGLLSSFDVAPWSKIRASSTCGVTGPEKFCYLTDLGFELGHYCDNCDASYSNSSHTISNVIDGSNSWWKSSNGRNKVSITFDFEKELFISFVALMMGPSPKPADWVLERSTDFGKSYRPWQFFAERPQDCKRLYGIPANLAIRTPDQVICQSDTFKILKNEEVFVMLIKGRTVPVDFSLSPLIQNWTRATNIRLRFFRLQTLGGEKIHSDKSATRRHFYSMRSIVIGGRCMCNGHESGCLFDTKKKEVRCQCADHTCGPTCSECCLAYRQQPWSAIGACKACNCHGHSDQCVYNETVAKLGLSLNSDGNYVGGGVCLDCRHNTSGINCQECQPNYYRVPGLRLNDSTVCQYCDCDSDGSLSERCHANGGQCPCRWLVGGLKCDRCVSPTVWDFPHCKPCNCFKAGSLNEECDSKTGQCSCRDGMTGLKCDVCAHKETQILTLGGCLECDRCGVSLIEKTASTLLPLISESTDFTIGLKSDLDRQSNFVERRLDWMRESTTIGLMALKKLPLSNLKASEDIQILSQSEGNIIHLGSLWIELDMASKYMLPLASAVSLSARRVLERTEHLISYTKASELRIQNNVAMLSSLKFSCKNNRCRHDGNLETLVLPVARWSSIKKNSARELDKAKQLYAFVSRYLWTTRRVRVSLKTLQKILKQSSEKSFESKKLFVHLKSTPLRVVLAKISELKRQHEQLLIPDKNVVSSLRSDLQNSHNTIIELNNKLSNVKYERFKEWSRESIEELEEFIIDVMWPNVLALEEVELLILKLFRYLESKMFVRKEMLDNFESVSRFMADANRSITFLTSIEWLSKKDHVDGSADGSGAVYDDEDYVGDMMYEEQLVSVEERISSHADVGLETKKKAQRVVQKLEALSVTLEEQKKQLKLVSICVEQVAKELNLLAYGIMLESSLKLGTVGLNRKDVLKVADSALELRTSMTRKYGAVDLKIESSLTKFTDATFAVSNATLKLEKVFQVSNNMKRFFSVTARINDTLDRVRNSVKRFHQLAAWFNTPVTLTNGHFNIPLVEDAFLTPYSLTTRVEMSFRPVESNSFLLLLGNPIRKDVSDCFALVRINASRVKVTVGQGNQTLELQNTLSLTHGHWYHMDLKWIQGAVNISVSPLENEKFRSVVGGQLTMELPTVRRFFPAAVWIGGYSETLPATLNASEFHGSLSGLRLNTRPLGLMSKSSIPFSLPATTKKLDTLSFDGFDFLRIDVAPDLPIFIDFHIRTLQRDAIVLFVQFQSELWLAVTLRGGELFVEFETQRNDKVFSERSLLGSGLHCNNGRLHSVQIKLLNTRIATLHLSVDTLYRNSVKLRNIDTLLWSALYVGGVPNTIRDDDAFAALCPATNFQGCLMQYRIANRSLVSTSSLSTSMVSCPHDLILCVCSLDRSIQVKPLGFEIRDVAVSFALSTPLKPSQTVLHYSTSPYTGLKIEVGGEKNWIKVSFWARGDNGVRRFSGGGRRSMVNTTWHLITLSTNTSRSILNVDGDVWEEKVGLVQKRLFMAQQLLFLGPETDISDGSVCYRDLLLNGRPIDLSPYVVSSGATVCSVTL